LTKKKSLKTWTEQYIDNLNYRKNYISELESIRDNEKSKTEDKEKAKELLVANNKLAYYEEVYKALNGYLSDKLQMPVAELSKDAIKVKLTQHEVPEENVLSLLKIIDSCEFARYAPGGTSEMEDLYSDTLQVLNKIDQQLKA
jgi:vacuolar-type H+-ATPase subunit I/STV1